MILFTIFGIYVVGVLMAIAMYWACVIWDEIHFRWAALDKSTVIFKFSKDA